MKIVIDTDACKKQGKDVDVALYLLSILAGSKITLNTFEKARQQGLLKFKEMYDRNKPFPETVSLSQTGEYVAESINASGSVGVKNENRFLNLANQMIEIFPKGKKLCQSGTKMPWRGNPNTIADRLEKFVAKYGDYSDEEFINATKRYVADYMGKSTMRVLMYFIYKNVDGEKKVVDGRMVGDRDRISMLADYLSNPEEDEGASLNWDVILK